MQSWCARLFPLSSCSSINAFIIADDDYEEDDFDPLAPELPPQLYIPDWNAFNAGANVAAAAANAVRGALGSPCHGGCGGGNYQLVTSDKNFTM